MEVFHGTTVSRAELVIKSDTFLPNASGYIYVTSNYHNACGYAQNKSLQEQGNPAVVTAYVVDVFSLIKTSFEPNNEYKALPHNLKPKNYTEIPLE